MSRTLRSIWLTRLVLTWFVMFVGVSIAAPVIHPTSQQLVCSASGASKLVDLDSKDSTGSQHASILHCALCLPVSATFPAPSVPDLSSSHLGHVLRAPVPAFLACAEALTPLSRGPPSLS